MTAQRVLIHDLTQIIDEEPRNVAIIVGAGVSIGALVGTAAQSLASWSGLLRNGIERAREAGGLRADDAQRYVELLSSEDSDAWVLVAEAVTKGLGGGGRVSPLAAGDCRQLCRTEPGDRRAPSAVGARRQRRPPGHRQL